MKNFNTDHQLRDESLSDLSLLVSLLVRTCLDCLIIEVTLLRNLLNFFKLAIESLSFAFL